MKLAELVNHYRAKLDILSDAALIGEIPERIDEIPDELKKFLVVGRILESDILDDSVGYKYPTYGLLFVESEEGISSGNINIRDTE